ncbi:MAG: H(+)/Cl(-) exchange transporter ClcA [Planctomycetota bacterium]
MANDTSKPNSTANASSRVRLLARFLEEEKKYTPMLCWAALVGSLAGLVGGLFRIFVTKIAHWRFSAHGLVVDVPPLNWVGPILISAWMVALSLLLVRRFANEAAGSGVQEIEGALDGVRPIRWRRVLPVKFFAGLLSMGGGMVLGREGPTIQMGGNVGGMIAELLKVTKDEAHVLIAAGAGSGLAAAFNAPLAGVLFVVEEMRPQFRYNLLSVQAVIIATSTATFVVRLLLGQGSAVPMTIFEPPQLASLWLFPVMGALFGVFGCVFNYLVVTSLDFYAGLKGILKSVSGLAIGTYVGTIGWLAPDLIGSGDVVVPEVIRNELPFGVLLVLFAARFGTTILCYGSGVPGGIFSPMLAIGTLFGMWFGLHAHHWMPDLVPQPAIFAIAGMGALFVATVGAPLTGVVLTIEITHNYALTLALMLTSVAATTVAQGLGGKPIYTVLLKRTLDQAGVKHPVHLAAESESKVETPAPPP